MASINYLVDGNGGIKQLNYRDTQFWDAVGRETHSTITVISCDVNTYMGNKEAGARVFLLINGKRAWLQMALKHTVKDTCYVLDREHFTDESEAT